MIVWCIKQLLGQQSRITVSQLLVQNSSAGSWLSMDKRLVKSLEWMGANPNVLPVSIREALMCASGAPTSKEADLAESGVSGSCPSEADSISGKYKSYNFSC